MHTKTKLVAAIVAALGLATSSAFATMDSSQAGWKIQDVSNSASQIAKKGRGGQDGLIYLPEQPEILGAKGRGGHDDALPDDEQPEVEILGAKGRGGHDDALPEDQQPEVEILGAKGRGGHDDALPEDQRPEVEILGAKGSGKKGGRVRGGSGCDGADDISDQHPACV